MSADEEQQKKSGLPVAAWVIPLAAVVGLGGGGALFWVSQSGALGSASSEGPGLRSLQYSQGDKVDIWRNEHWYPGVIERRDDDRYRVVYDRANMAPPEWVDASRLQPRTESTE